MSDWDYIIHSFYVCKKCSRRQLPKNIYLFETQMKYVTMLLDFRYETHSRKPMLDTPLNSNLLPYGTTYKPI